MTHLIEIKNLNQIDSAAADFLALTKKHRLIAFYGEMGAGKTTFIKALCKQLGVADIINSPTFSIVNEYGIENSEEKVFHFDFYRLKKAEEAFDFGVEDYFFSGNYCLMEWPEIVEEILPQNCLKVQIKELEDQKREIHITNLNL
ncbi:MAG: tRNA (adenosine(37)-N6)-threonylcarbamoyltransferase complex ATPase subunit type 1 TsaE [Paludibacteraceae bacterium]|jgi:tRNA threonylcarbamoyladenosine biosynthesis protein TsaE|nr:tRNA (adenosine(37)-N6)-threonylcarbamoyltransferase complex ATPase subunit type 1 TsaE [Paludibacteraceae bacterium]